MRAEDWAMAKGDEQRDEKAREMRQLSLGLTIPGMFLAGPLVGWALGWAIHKYVYAGGWVIPLCIVLGFVAGIRQIIMVIRDMNRQ